MKSKINQYHLHKDDYSKLHFEIKDAKPHLEKYPDHVFKAHRHTYYQFIWFKNSGHHYVDYEIYEHPANALFLLNKNQVHYFCPFAKNDGKLYHFDEVFLNKGSEAYRNQIEFHLFSEVGKPFLVLDEEMISLLEMLTTQLEKESKERKYNFRELIFSFMQSFILAVDRLKSKESIAIPKYESNQSIALQFKKLIEENMHKFLSIDQYSASLNISSKKLSKISKEFLLFAPKKYIAQRKIIEAKRLLSNVDIPIKEVAFELGFDQATYFSKYFKKETGITPKEFVKQIHG